MSTHKHFERICCGVLAGTLLLTILFLQGNALGLQQVAKTLGYTERLFDTSTVHTIDIVMEDWETFLSTCENEEYNLCSLVIDGEAYQNVGLRAKGNTSLTQVAAYGNDRYSFKVEFDCYDAGKTYYGLDKLSLNNLIQDNTCMKDYLCYQLMGQFGVAAPLCSYVWLTVNGEDWGLYLAAEGVEEGFLQRNYGNNYGQLYKPDSQDFGGGRGNGGGFDMADWQNEDMPTPPAMQNPANAQDISVPSEGTGSRADGEAPHMQFPPDRQDGLDRQSPPEGTSEESLDENTERSFPASGNRPFSREDQPDAVDGFGGFMQKNFGGMGSSDVSLIYTDDSYASYQSIFDNAKTAATDVDKDRLIAALKQLNNGENIENVVDIEQVIRYFVVHSFVCNFDSYTGSMIHNYYLYEDNGQLAMIPWDYNLAFGGFMGAQDASALVNYPIDTPVSGGTVESRPMLAWIFSDDNYMQIYHQYFQQFLAEVFECGYFAEELDRVRTLIQPYVEKDPTKFCTYGQFEAGVDTLKEFCLLRAQSISGQLEGSIPSTSEGQAQQPEALLDAANVDISAMGGMDNSRAGAGKPSSAEDGDTAASPFDRQPRGEQPPSGTIRGAGEGVVAANTSLPIGQGNWVVGICAICLLAALLLTSLYQKRA